MCVTISVMIFAAAGVRILGTDEVSHNLGISVICYSLHTIISAKEIVFCNIARECRGPMKFAVQTASSVIVFLVQTPAINHYEACFAAAVENYAFLHIIPGTSQHLSCSEKVHLALYSQQGWLGASVPICIRLTLDVLNSVLIKRLKICHCVRWQKFEGDLQKADDVIGRSIFVKTLRGLTSTVWHPTPGATAGKYCMSSKISCS